jgi:hypothetical protein
MCKMEATRRLRLDGQSNVAQRTRQARPSEKRDWRGVLVTPEEARWIIKRCAADPTSGSLRKAEANRHAPLRSRVLVGKTSLQIRRSPFPKSDLSFSYRGDVAWYRIAPSEGGDKLPVNREVMSHIFSWTARAAFRLRCAIYRVKTGLPVLGLRKHGRCDGDDV